MRRRKSVLGVMTVALLMVAGVAVAMGHLQPSTTNVQPVLSFADEPNTGGESVLTRTDTMVLASIEAVGLTPGNAYTVWWVVFNNPGACSDAECGEDDIFVDGDPANGLNVPGVMGAEIAVGNATGNIAKTDGTSEFGARLKRNDGDTSGHQILFPAGLTGDSVLTASGNDAEVHIVIQNHGQARGGQQLSNQLSLVETGCTPFCADVQFAVHQP